MRKVFFIAMIIASVSGIAIAGELTVEPTAFESFVARPSVVVEVDEPIGSIVSADATLAIALLVAGSVRSSRPRSRISPQSNPAFPD